MATGRKFYWFKLRKDFMEGDEVDYIMSLDDGAKYIVLYIMLCIMCVNTDGMLLCRLGDEVVPANMQKIKRSCRFFDEETIRDGLAVFLKLGLIYKSENDILAIAGFEDLVGSVTDYAAQKKKQREKKRNEKGSTRAAGKSTKKPSKAKGNMDIPISAGVDFDADSYKDTTVDTYVDMSMDTTVDTVHTEKEKDKELDKDKEKDNFIDNHKSLEGNNFKDWKNPQNITYSSDSSCPEPKENFASGLEDVSPKQSTAETDSGEKTSSLENKKAVAVFPLADGTFYRVSPEEAEYYQSLFPMHDAAFVLKSMSRWLAAHPDVIASAGDARQFVVRWFTSGPPVLSDANADSAVPAESGQLPIISGGHTGNGSAVPEASSNGENKPGTIDPMQDGGAAAGRSIDSMPTSTTPGGGQESPDSPVEYRQEELFPLEQKPAYSNKVFSYPLNDGTYFQVSAENKEYYAAFYDGRDLDGELERIGEYFNRFSMHLKSPDEISGFIESWIMDGPAAEPDPVYELDLNDGSAYPVYEEDIAYYQGLYPAVDIDSEFRKMIGWIDGNPNKRKTKRGIKRFINSWLSKAQDRGGSGNGNGYTGRTAQMLEGSYQMYADWAREMEEKEKGAANDIR